MPSVGSVESLGVFRASASTWTTDVYVPQNLKESKKKLAKLGGVEKLLDMLTSDARDGIAGTAEDLEARKMQFGENVIPQKPLECEYALVVRVCERDGQHPGYNAASCLCVQ